MNPSLEGVPFHRLDHAPVVSAWQPSLAAVLLELHQSCSRSDAVTITRFDNFVHTHEGKLRVLAQFAEKSRLKPPEGVHERHPMSSVLLLRGTSRHASVGLDILLAATCEASLRASTDLERKQIAKLTSALRGALEQAPNSRLQIVLAGSKTLAEIHGRLEAAYSEREPGQSTFAPHWRSWFGARIHEWLFRDPARLRKALEPTLVPPDDATTITVRSDIDADPDDTIDLPVVGTVDEPEAGILPFHVERGRARANALVRASEGDLLADPAWFLPGALVKELASSAQGAANNYLRSGELREAEPHVALTLALASGLRDLDFADLRWGEAPTQLGSLRPTPRLDPTRPLMHWPIVRPPSAKKPVEPLAQMEQSVDVLAWPLPPKVHSLARALWAGHPPRGACVFPSHERGERLLFTLRDVVSKVVPGLFVGATAIRRVFASELARRLGPDVAQLTLSDSFSHSIAPTYYAAPRVRDVASTIRDIQLQWFDEPSDIGNAIGVFGSRIVPKDDAAHEWATSLLAKRRSAVHRKQRAQIDGWIAHRNFLAGSLCAATGHRPVDAIAQLTVNEIIPEHGSVILRDKQIDPLRLTRVAATGARWIAELRDYLDRLVDLSKCGIEARVAQLSAHVLRGEAPLFSAPSPQGDTFDSTSLVATMPAGFQKVRNHYRHRLNQQMMWRGVDPELRMGQMGWVVSPAYFTADLSHSSALDLGRQLGPTIDEILIEDRWFSRNRRLSKWHWDGVPMSAMLDWDAVAARHQEDHEKKVNHLREVWIERGREAREKILPRLAKAVHTVLPRLALDEQARRLVLATEYHRRDPVEIDAEHCELIINLVRSQDERDSEALETAATRILLHNLLRGSHKKGVTKGILPRRPIFSATAQPSPFLDGSGRAIRHADRFREILMDRMHAEATRERGILATLSVMCFSPYRDIHLARAAVDAAPAANRAKKPGDWLRIPAKVEGQPYPMIFNGTAALLLARRVIDAPTARAPSIERIDEWLKANLPSDMTVPSGMTHLQALVRALRAAGRLELSGQERFLMLGDGRFAAASVERCLAVDDNWPIRTDTKCNEVDDELGVAAELAPEPSVPAMKGNSSSKSQYYRQLLPLLNPHSLPVTLGKDGDSRKGLHSAQLERLKSLRAEVGEESTIGLLAGFAIRLLTRGGKKGRPLAAVSAHTAITRFAGDLIAALGDRSLLVLDAPDLHKLYFAVLSAKSRKARAESIESIESFQRYLQDDHQAIEIEFDEMRQLAGSRIRDPDPGILTDHEVNAVCTVLHQDVLREHSCVDASPQFRRLTEMQLLTFILAEASGLRPASLYGLLLGDLHLLAEGADFLHVHRTGGFGSAKTNTSIGFVPLQGHLWARERHWVLEWLEGEHTRLAAGEWWRAPLFAHGAGSRRRFSETRLKERIGQLLRWVTGEHKARLYWCRKRRVRIRHSELLGREDMPLAREVHAILAISGHAGISTPFESYICDPSVPMAHSLRDGRMTSRADILASTNLKPEPLDVEWGRKGGASCSRRMEIVFSRLRLEAMAVPTERVTPPPQSRRQKGLLPIHIDLYARAMQKHGDRLQAIVKASLSTEQADAIDTAATELLLVRGRVPWKVEGLQHPRAIMKPARRIKGTNALFEALKNEPTDTLSRFAKLWGRRGFSRRIVANGLSLVSGDEVALAREAMCELGFQDPQISIKEIAPIHLLSVDGIENVCKYIRRCGLQSALDWTLSVVWIQQKVTSNRKIV